jgi:hypothetical protein
VERYNQLMQRLGRPAEERSASPPAAVFLEAPGEALSMGKKITTNYSIGHPIGKLLDIATTINSLNYYERLHFVQILAGHFPKLADQLACAFVRESELGQMLTENEKLTHGLQTQFTKRMLDKLLRWKRKPDPEVTKRDAEIVQLHDLHPRKWTFGRLAKHFDMTLTAVKKAYYRSKKRNLKN